MKIRGERECTACGTRWSYYETGSVGCPACGSLRSVGVDERTEHTDLEAEFDLTPVRADVDGAATAELAERARERATAYVRRRGFVRGGELRPIDDDYLAAAELRYVCGVVDGRMDVDDREALYFLSLLRGADAGDRPAPEAVPASMWGPRGLACADAVSEFRRDVRRWADGRELSATERSLLERLGDHVRRIRALDGDVPPRSADRLVEAARELGVGLRDGNEETLSHARELLDGLE